MAGIGGFGFSSTNISDPSITSHPPSAPITGFPPALAPSFAAEVGTPPFLVALLPTFSPSCTRDGGKGPSRRSVELYGFTGGTRLSSRFGGTLDGYETAGAETGGRTVPPGKPRVFGAGISRVADDLFLISVLPSIVRDKGRDGCGRGGEGASMVSR